uniref:Uncharacterized protein n=1 Tax=Anguilla anguilla TaxID=7936 RepID=A0A0E9SWK6_ANGAN
MNKAEIVNHFVLLPFQCKYESSNVGSELKYELW